MMKVIAEASIFSLVWTLAMVGVFALLHLEPNFGTVATAAAVGYWNGALR